MLTGFWLVAGALSTPAATFQRYVGAWQHDDARQPLSCSPRPELDAQRRPAGPARTTRRRTRAASTRRPGLDLNAQDPRSNLRFVEQPELGGDGTFEVEVVHDVSVPGTFLGFIPASRTETQVLAVLGHVDLARYPITG